MWDMHDRTTPEQAERNRMTQLVEQLKRHEGLRLKPYQCTAGKLTIGIGRNIEDIGISESEAEMLLSNDIQRVVTQLKETFPWTLDLDEVRFAALVNFTFNVGIGTTSKFVNAMALLKGGNFDMAADEFLDSRWAKQVGQRAVEITEQIRTGEWQ
jgi:lysozyme